MTKLVKSIIEKCVKENRRAHEGETYSEFLIIPKEKIKLKLKQEIKR